MNTEPASQDPTVLELCDVNWLLDHHRTKEPERRQMVADLKLKPGDFILDLACGPGLWSRMFAEQVQPHGRVVGVDGAPELIAYAKSCCVLRELTTEERAQFGLPLLGE